jgi:serine/threonine protein phosphatase PrpC
MHHGLHHNSNEDNMSIQLGSKSMFGLFDGYGGAFASSYLKKLLTN